MAYADLARAAAKLRRAQAAAEQDLDLILIDAPELAARLDVPVRWLYEQARQGKLPSVRFSRRVFFDARAVVEEIRARATGAKP